MKDSLLRAPRAGIPLRGKAKKNHRPDSKLNFEDGVVSPSSSSQQISIITDDVSATSSNSVVAAAGDLDELGSNSPVLSLLFEDFCDPDSFLESTQSAPIDPIGAQTGNTKEAVASADLRLHFEDIVGAEDISTGSSEVVNLPGAGIVTGKWSGKDDGERNLDAAIVRFSMAMEKLGDAIWDVLQFAVEQGARQGRDSIFFSLSRLAETTLASLISIMLVSFLISVVSLKGCPNNSLEFRGPAPT